MLDAQIQHGGPNLEKHFYRPIAQQLLRHVQEHSGRRLHVLDVQLHRQQLPLFLNHERVDRAELDRCPLGWKVLRRNA